jgi:thymidylate synthase (FAD)
MRNTVELLGFYGSDQVHAQSAWTSTSRDLTPEKLDRIPKLLRMLASEGHHTPFEKSTLHFLVNVDQATHIHLLKHRIGVSINGESARYKELKEDKMYIPEDWKGIRSTKPLFIHDEDADGNQEGGELSWKEGTTWESILQDYTEIGNYLYHNCLEDLTAELGRKRAKESARFFKTINSQISMDVMFNFRSFMMFQKLRNDIHAQKEVRELAQQMLEIVQDLPWAPFKHSLEAFGYGKV